MFPVDWDVYGLRLSLAGAMNENVYGLDVGLGAGGALQTFGGLQASFLNMGGMERTVGVQLGVLSNGGHNLSGAQIGLVNSCREDSVGMQLGVQNYAEHFRGFQIGIGSVTIPFPMDFPGVVLSLGPEKRFGCSPGALAEDMSGIQLSILYNRAKVMNGLQVGFVNDCEDMTGIQIGAINIIRESPLKFFPVINAKF